MARKMNVKMNIIARKNFNLQHLVAFKSRYFSWKVCDLNFCLWMYPLCHFLNYSAEKKMIFFSFNWKKRKKKQNQTKTLRLFFPLKWTDLLVWLKIQHIQMNFSLIQPLQIFQVKNSQTKWRHLHGYFKLSNKSILLFSYHQIATKA